MVGNGRRNYWGRDGGLCEVSESHFCLWSALFADLAKDALFSTQILHDLNPLLRHILKRLLHAHVFVIDVSMSCFLVSDSIVRGSHVVMA